jgi:hypothetical protein
MDRRQFIAAMIGAAALLGAGRATDAECGEETSTAFVEALYQKQARLKTTDTPRSEDDFEVPFARELRRLMRAPKPDLRNQPIGRLLHGFFGWGVLPVTEVAIGKVAVVSGSDNGPATIAVEFSYRGEQHKVLVGVVVENEMRRIADISYDSGGSLAEYYRRLTRR